MRIKNNWSDMLPIFILENGVADKSDRYRAPFIIAHLQQVKRAIDNGAKVIGYLHWSFMDNYEWLENYRAESKFGLFSIDYGNSNNQFDLARQSPKGAEAFRIIVEESLAQNKNGTITDSAISKVKDKYGIFAPDGSEILQRSKRR
jgi:beta-glucosidase/6-phospho-beta-glucosidase/beta-galactosidase